MEGHRYERVAETIREEIVEMIAYELEDSRLQGIEVVDVQVSPDMKKAVISVVTPSQGEEQERSWNSSVAPRASCASNSRKESICTGLQSFISTPPSTWDPKSECKSSSSG